MGKKAQAFTWLMVMIAIFGMGLIFIIMNEAYDAVDAKVGDNFTGSQYEPTYQKIGTIWDLWPFIFLIGVLVYGVLSALKRKGDFY